MSERPRRRPVVQTLTRENRRRSQLVAARITCRGGAGFNFLAFLAVVFAFGALAWMMLLPLVVTSQLRARTGFDATIKRLAVNPIAGTVSLAGFVVTNPPTFSVREFLQLREFKANAELLSLFTDHPVFETMTVDIEKVTLVKRKDGATNAEAFKKNFEIRPDGKPRPPRQSPPKQFFVRRLELRVDQLVMVDQSLREPRVQEFTLGINQTYVDVTDLTQLMSPKALQSLAPIASAASALLPGEFGRALSDSAKSGTEAVKEAARATSASAKRFFDALEESKKP